MSTTSSVRTSKGIPRHLICVLQLMLWLQPCYLNAQAWIPIGPFDKPVSTSPADFSVNNANGVGRAGVVRFAGNKRPKMIMCTPYDGLRVSQDGGRTWSRPAMRGIPAIGIADVISLDASGAELLAVSGDADCGLNPDYPAMNSESCQSRGLYHSYDGGMNWKGPVGRWHRSDGSIDTSFWNYPSLKISRRLLLPKGRKGPWFVVVHTCEVQGRNYRSWVFRSLNCGKDWFPVLELMDGWLKTLVAHPANPSLLYACGRSVHMSCDGGDSWKDIGRKGLPADSVVDRCEPAFGPSPDYRLFILVNNRLTKANELYAIRRDEVSFAKLTAGAASPPWRTALAHDPKVIGRLYFSAGNKVNRFDSINGTWRAVATAAGLHDDIHEIVQDPSGDRMLVSNDGGIHSTADGGFTWSDLSNGLDVSEPWGVSIASHEGRLKILCGTQDCGTSLFETDTQTISGVWRIVRGGDGMKPIIDRSQPGRMIAVDGNNNLNHFSGDGSRTWKTLRSASGSRAEYLRPLVADPLHPETLYTGHEDVFRSMNEGSEWQALGLPGKGTIAAIAVAPSDPRIIYAAYSGPSWSDQVSERLYRTVDGGMTWTDISRGLRGASWTSISCLAVSPSDPFDLAVGFRGGWSVKAMRYDTSGTGSWKDITEGLPPDAELNALLFDPDPDKRSIYGATHQGVFKWDAASAMWTDFNGDQPPVLSVDLDIDPVTRWMCLATHGRGVWLTRLD